MRVRRSKGPGGTPFTFEVREPEYHKIAALKESGGFGSVSDIVLSAVNALDLNLLESDGQVRRQISVRVPEETLERLRAYSREEGVSIGNLFRTALRQFVGDEKNAGAGRSRSTATQCELFDQI